MQYSNPIDLAKSRGVSRGFVPLTSRFLQAAMEKAEIAARDKAAAEKAAAEKVSRQVSKNCAETVENMDAQLQSPQATRYARWLWITFLSLTLSFVQGSAAVGEARF